MDMVKKHDAGLIVAGVLLVLCALLFLLAPGIALVTLTAIAGAAFLVSGIFDIVSYVRFRTAMRLSGWAVAYAVLDIVVGLMLLIHPFAFAAVIPWMVGFFFALFGVVEIAGSLRIRKAGVPMWGWMLFSGIVSVLCGLAFFVVPTTLSIFLAVFVLMRGASLIMYGWNAGKVMML
ncbi:hypothetical protein B5F40_10755 [Gordonibacter sp. An230]|uniref:HdeD family acid-resistance protein n=1 Tax=Gordonibacter sp. An230 TaxID=1965592 RepID=UPI000B3864D4|nr:DUF308 domain-containing protein [Gordonibacter sp. An230]OUO89495.1 hypothetical protein B5F40_10755 [Gordonibacter sp. An230]